MVDPYCRIVVAYECSELLEPSYISKGNSNIESRPDALTSSITGIHAKGFSQDLEDASKRREGDHA